MNLNYTRLLLAALATLFFCSLPAEAWWNRDWALRKEITVDGASKDARFSGPVERPALLLRLHEGNFDFGSAAEDGSDLRFVSADDKTELPFYIEKYDPLFNEAFVWVGLPEVKPGEKLSIWLYFSSQKAGGAAAETKEPLYSDAVQGVYHFSEQGTAPNDASGKGNHAENPGTAANGAIIGGGLRLPGAAPVKVAGTPSNAWKRGGSLTFSAWVKASALAPNAVFFTRRDGAEAFVVGLNNELPYVETVSQGTPQRAVASKGVTQDAWHHLAIVFEGGNATFWIDGEEAGSAAATLPELKSEFQIGAGGEVAGTSSAMVGELDEMQLVRLPLSADAIRFAAIVQGADRAAALVSLGEDAAPEGLFDFMHGGFMGIIMESLTIDGWIVIIILVIMMFVSWWIMYDKARYLNGIARANTAFLDEWRHVSGDFAVLDEGDDNHARNLGGRVDDGKRHAIRQSSIYRIYHIGVQEVRNRVVRDRERGSRKGLSGRSMAAIRASLEGGFIHELQKLNARMVLLTIAISGGPFLGLLGTVVGVMITFAAVAEAGDVNVNAIAPGIAAALAATVAGLAVAIPALFGYNYLLARVKEASAHMQIFIDEFITKAGEFYDSAN